MLFPDEPARRLFIGLMPGRGVRAAIQAHCRGWDWPADCKLTRPSRLHLTLHFLGQVDAEREQALRAALRDVTMEPLELVLCTPQAWSGGIAVLRPDEHAGLSVLHERIGHALMQAHLRPGSRFTPHVTLARNAMHAKPSDALPSVLWTVREFVLVWSQLPPDVRYAHYEVLGRYGAGEGNRTLV